MSHLQLERQADTDSGNARAALTSDERERFARHLREIFIRLGLAPDSPGTRRTPDRWLQAMIDMTRGYEGDAKLETQFPAECPDCTDQEREQVIEGPISFFALCEHHALPIQGQAWIAYLPDQSILGISKLTRLVRLYARRFTSQERITHQVANHLMQSVRPRGVAVYLHAHHACTQARGVGELGSATRTYAMRGAYLTESRLRDEFLRVCSDDDVER